MNYNGLCSCIYIKFKHDSIDFYAKTLQQENRCPQNVWDHTNVKGSSCFILQGSGSSCFIILCSGSGSSWFIILGSGSVSGSSCFILQGSGSGSSCFILQGSGSGSSCFILQGSSLIMFSSLSSLTNTIFPAADLSSAATPPDISACFKN